MSAAFWIAFWWGMFAGTHMVLSSLPVRSKLVSRLGEKAFLGLYSLVAFATFIPLVWVYLDNRHGGAWCGTLRRCRACGRSPWRWRCSDSR